MVLGVDAELDLASCVARRVILHCPPGLTPKDVAKLGRYTRVFGVPAVNRVLGWVVLCGQFVAINVVLPWIFLPLFMFSEDSVFIRVIAGTLTALALWVAYLLVESAVRYIMWERVVRIEIFVWAAGILTMLVLSATLAMEP